MSWHNSSFSLAIEMWYAHHTVSDVSFFIIFEPHCEKTYLLARAFSEVLNQPAHPRSLIRIFVVCRKKLCIQNAPNKDSDQTARMRRLIWIFAGRRCPKVTFLSMRLTSSLAQNGDTPLHCAARSDKKKAIKTLAECGAALDIRNKVSGIK